MTDEILKYDKSIDSIELHSENIEFILSTCEVSILVKSSDFNELHPKNVDFILFVFDVSKLDKSIETAFSIFMSNSLLK